MPANETHDWFSGVDVSGLVLSEPVLAETFPDGYPETPAGDRQWFRRRHERYRVALERFQRLRARDADVREPRRDVRLWIDFVLQDHLVLPADHWRKRDRLPEELIVSLPDYRQDLRPDRVLLDRDGRVALAVLVVDPDQDLDRRDRKAGRWKVTPTVRLERLLQETGLELGLLTNGESWRLLFCPRGGTTGSWTWTSDVLADENRPLDGIGALLSPDLLRPEGEASSLVELCRLSRERQAEVADQLGAQVLEGLELLLEELDRQDRASGGELLADLDDDELYELLVVVMMRLVFLLYAEENRLLPHGELLYDQGYGVTHLWRELRLREEEGGEGVDAWRRFLATARLVHRGCDHPDLATVAYGGLLFDPARFPALEDPRMGVRNAVVREVLEKLLFARPRRGARRQRVGYWSLSVEALGYMYEGLLDRRVARAGDEAVVKLSGRPEGYPASELLDREQGALLHLIRSGRGQGAERDRARIAERLEAGATEEQLARLRRRHSPDFVDRLAPLAPVLDCCRCVDPGWRYLTTARQRRSSGTHYTPEFLTEEVVRTTLEPLVYAQEDGRPGVYVERDGRRVLRPLRELLALKVADVAMGSGAFLVQVVRYLGDQVLESWRRAAAEQEGARLVWPYAEESEDSAELELPFEDRARLEQLARRAVAQRCVYGVDVNPYAVEMAKLSLWLVTLSKDDPFTFLDHALKCGDSLVGAHRDQLERGSLRRGGAVQHPPGLARIRELLADAQEKRARIRRRPVRDAGDAEEMARLLREAEEATADVRLAADALVAGYLGATSTAGREGLVSNLMSALEDGLVSGDHTPVREEVAEALGENTPFHWFVEFPEVFEDEEDGFDAVVGNPPFLGGQHLSGAFGQPYREYLVDVLGLGKRGSADYVSYFVLRVAELLGPGGHAGLLATNTVAQGDTRENGLDQLHAWGWEIRQAVKSMPWPGAASLEVARVTFCRRGWEGSRELDGAPVVFAISPTLDSGPAGKPHQLKANEGISFQGSNILGTGFTMPPEEARELIDRDERNADILQPYLNGKDLNSRPDQSPSRWVINFQDWPLRRGAEGRWEGASEQRCRAWLRAGIVPDDYPDPVAADYPELLAIVEERVRPQREAIRGRNATAEQRRRIWWRFTRPALELYDTIELLDRAFCRARVSEFHSIAAIPTDIVVSEAVVVFAWHSWGGLTLLQSSIHEAWIAQWSSSLETRTRYTPSDCFETFPLPEDRQVEDLEDVGREFDTLRAAVMHARGIGLTDAANVFHDPDRSDEDVARLREALRDMDYAVLAVYGWSDEVDLEHGWHETRRKIRREGRDVTVTRPRWGISPMAAEQVVHLLFDLNQCRHREEVEEDETPVAPRRSPPARSQASLPFE